VDRRLQRALVRVRRAAQERPVDVEEQQHVSARRRVVQDG
jgi:hypothetical protein